MDQTKKIFIRNQDALYARGIKPYGINVIRPIDGFIHTKFSNMPANGLPFLSFLLSWMKEGHDAFHRNLTIA